MKIKNFLEELNKQLQNLDEDERKETINYYSEILNDLVEEGKSEQEAINSIDDIKTIKSKLIKEDFSLYTIKEKISPHINSTNKVLIITLLIVGFPLWFSILSAILSVILAIFTSLFAIIFSLYAVNLSLLIAGVGETIISFIYMPNNLSYSLSMISIGLIAISLSLFMYPCTIYLSKKTWKLTKIVFKRIIKFLSFRKVVK